MEFDEIIAAQKEEWGDPIPPAIERNELSEWTMDKDGLALKACALRGLGGVRYGLIIARRDDEGYFEDPRSLTREQMETVRDFVGHVLKDSEG